MDKLSHWVTFFNYIFNPTFEFIFLVSLLKRVVLLQIFVETNIIFYLNNAGLFELKFRYSKIWTNPNVGLKKCNF